MFWVYHYTPSPDAKVCCGANNRGVAILGDTLYMGTLDAHLVAIDAKTGQLLWNTAIADVKLAYSITMAPLVVKDKVVVGVGGGEFGIRGFVAAYDAKTGKEAWKFYTIPGPGEAGHETWEPDDWEHGGGLGLDHRLVRSGAKPDLLGHRQSGARLEPGPAPRRQPLFRQRGGARRRHRQAEVALPVHAERRLRLRFACRCRCWPTSSGRARRPR